MKIVKNLPGVDKRLTQLRKLTEVSRAFTYAVSLEEVLDLAVARAAELLESDRAVLMLTNAEGLLSVRAAFGLAREVTEKFREPLDETLATRLRGLLDVEAERFLGVPLVVGGEVTGILAVPLPSAGANTEESEWMLSALADQAAVAIEKTRLDEAAKFRERVIGIVSHDLRNPIGTILLAANVLLHYESLDEKATKLAARIQSSASRAGRMISDLLDYTRAQGGSRLPVDRRDADFDTIVRQAVEELEANHPQRKIEVDSPIALPGEWDADRLAQVVENIVGNAIAYSPPTTNVNVVVTHDKHDVTLRVHNDGPPIAADRLHLIFEPMQRGTHDVHNRSRSVGLGLYIVKQLVEAHAGTVTVHTAAGEGTTFTVRLPRRKLSPVS